MRTDIVAGETGTQPSTAETPPWLIPPQAAPRPVPAGSSGGPAPVSGPQLTATAEHGDVDLSGIVPPDPAPARAAVPVHDPMTARPGPSFPPPPAHLPIAPPHGAPQMIGPGAPSNPIPSQPAPARSPMPGPAGPALDEVSLIRKARRPPMRGWRRAVHTLSAGTVNPGESTSELEYRNLLERVRQPVRGDYRIAVLSLKGGVGKTTTTVGLGSMFASLRGDRVIAVDANPDLGTLAQRVPIQSASTVRDLLADPVIARYSDVRAHTSQAPSRLEVIASERDPAAAEAFSEHEYRGVMTVLQRFYNIILTDCGTGMSHGAMRGVLDLADAVVLVSSPALDGARSAGATLDWLDGHGFGHLIPRSVVVLSSARPGASSIDLDHLSRHFLTRCRAVHTIGFDDHLSEGADVDLDLLGKHTRRSFTELAATIADDFGGTSLRRHPPFHGQAAERS
ncbi:MinD/ParA family protein [Gordonia zhaorongruii]|uniref:MinD/ParA family ATP-binding protein n=1 Tax=Gordonia zhaorongruii TaxID=2597659 RepID=UPI00104B47B5|nr:MinD/ParA family protein [Gordonia zhaorongruii]